MNKKKLFEEFAPVSGADWRFTIEADLKDADYDKKLVWWTEEGFDVQPYYRQEDLNPKLDQSVFLKDGEAQGNDWKIRQDFKVNVEAEACNCSIKNALKRGIQSIGIDLSEISKTDTGLMQKLLSEIDLESVELNFMNANDPGSLADSFFSYIAKQGFKAEKLSGSFGLDPLGYLSSKGEFREDHFQQISEIIRTYASSYPNFKIICLDSGQLQDGGSTLSQELGFGLAMANTTIAILCSKGLKADTILKTISFSMVTGPNYFMEIAKLRATRLLWSSISKEWSSNNKSLKTHIHSRSASWNLTVYDPNVNMLRTTTEAMSGSLGGSDTISVNPFDLIYREENDFSSRIASNTQIILKEESHFDKVADPAAGSYYIENLTESIAEQAWKHFLEVEEKGGYLEAFKSGWIQEKIRLSAENKRKNAASRRQTILGVNQYPNFGEMILDQGLIKKAKIDTKTSYPAILPFRISEELENLRLQTDLSGKRPKVFLLKYGDPVWMTARAMFSGNFFACAGYKIIDNAGYKTIEAGIEAARKSEAEIVVLCSSDAEYVTIASAAISKLKRKAEIVIAGYPTESLDELKSIGVEHFIHVKSNLLEELRKFNGLLVGEERSA
jgi:methylmalonyl-CoA mutase